MHLTVNDFLDDIVRRFGDRPALLFKPGFRYRVWSYRGLRDTAAQVAALLRERGVGKGDRVILWGPNAPHWAFAFFGCLRVGAILVPLDLRSTADFVRQVVAKTAPVLAFTSRATGGDAALGLPTILFEDLEGLIYDLPAAEPASLAGEDLAEIMFTSGTTGDAKGVLLTHGNLMANLHSVQQVIPGDVSFRMLSLLPMSHMFEQMGSLFAGLGCGANITFATSRQPAILLKTMQERRVNMMLLVPQALDLFMKSIEREVANRGKQHAWDLLMKLARRLPVALRRVLFRQVHARFGGHLRIVVSGGAALDPSLGEKWRLLGVSVLQGYGATEASPVISCHSLTEARFDSVGRPVPGVDVRISEAGEIQVRGANVTQGYWQGPEQTAAAFDGNWYRTGDIGFIDDGGHLHIRGRVKEMIVLANGQNVFPEDVEAVLHRNPALTDATVVGLQQGQDTQVHAVFLLEEPARAAEIVARANRDLAEHQQIRGFTVWPEADFPRTHTLKVKKAVLIDALSTGPPRPAGAAGAAGAHAPAAAAADPKERLVRLVSEVSGLAQEQVLPEHTVGGDLNLDSLKRVEMLSIIEQEMGVYIDESLVGSHTTFAELQELLDSQVQARAALPPFYTWPLSMWFSLLREVLHKIVVFPLFSVRYRARATGLEHLPANPGGPLLFAANHNAVRGDSMVLAKVTPRAWRRHLSFAAAAEVTFGKRLTGIFAALIANAFPLSRENAIRASLEHMGRLMDEGWSVVIFPEGEQRIGGPMLPFQSGTGMLAVESHTPVVPVHLVCEARRRRFRTRVAVRFGAPLTFPPGTSYLDATRQIEAAVKAL
ncbi:MAG: AMP-binding protein [Spirochaetaceae bacterium]|nr:AMP-binding protein [Spirochaetaceae bacterium]